MVVLSGTATIRFGVADTSNDMNDNTYGTAREYGGIEIEAKAGDVFIVPAGCAHKTFDTHPNAEFDLLTPGDGHHIAAGQEREALSDVEISGFTMLGAYPKSCIWDFMKGGEKSIEEFGEVWSVPIPAKDPLLGASEEGLVGHWTTTVR